MAAIGSGVRVRSKELNVYAHAGLSPHALRIHCGKCLLDASASVIRASLASLPPLAHLVTNQLTHAHQLDVELVQMAIELVIARVPPEMWVAIARAGPGEMAFAMERVCQTWRRALISAGDTLWKPVPRCLQ